MIKKKIYVAVLILFCVVSSVSCLIKKESNQTIYYMNTLNDNYDLQSTKIGNRELEIMVSAFLMNLKTSSRQFEFKDFPSETITELIRVNGTEYYFCKYFNDKDLVFFFFEGAELKPIFVLDANRSYFSLIDFYEVCNYDSKEYIYFYEILKNSGNL